MKLDRRSCFDGGSAHREPSRPSLAQAEICVAALSSPVHVEEERGSRGIGVSFRAEVALG